MGRLPVSGQSVASTVVKLVDGEIRRAQIGDDLVDMLWSAGFDHGVNLCQLCWHIIEQALVVYLNNIAAAAPDRCSDCRQHSRLIRNVDP